MWTVYGDVWFVEGASTALWRQRRVDTEEEYYVPEYAYAVPIAEDADWLGGWEAVYDGVTGLLDYDYGEGEADYNGYPLPDTEPAGQLCLTLDRDGTITGLVRKAPADALVIDFDVPESELAGAVKTLDVERRPEDEDTGGFWSKLTALEDGVRVRVERSAEDLGDVAELARIKEGTFLPGETVYDGVLNRGEFLALRASMPWHPELRVSVSKDGGWDSYVFGEDNWMHLWTEESIHPALTLSALPLRDPTESTGAGLSAALDGTWLYRDPMSGAIAAILGVYSDGTVSVETDEDYWQMLWGLGRLYAEGYEAPDLLTLHTEEPVDAGLFTFDGAAGDYLVDLYRTDGEETLHLTQANNGEGVLSYLLSGETPETWEYDFTFTRARGASATASRLRGVSFPAVAVRYDGENALLWVRKVEIVDQYEDGSPVWRPSAYAPCVAYSVKDTSALAYLADIRYGEHPLRFCTVTVDDNGEITALAAPES